MKLRYLMVVALLPVFAACSKSDKTEPAAATPVPAEAAASVTSTSVPDASVSDHARAEALTAETTADTEASTDTSPTPEAAAAPSPAPSSNKSAPDGKAAPKNVVAGVDYSPITGGEPFDTPAGKVEVAEIFNYVCPACAGFDPVFQEWKEKQPAYVHVVYVPADFRPDFKAYARAYYAAAALGLVEKTHEAVYKAIHEDHTLPGEGMTLEPAKIAAFYAKYGADPVEFQDLMTSFSVDAQVNKAHQFMMQSQIRSTPSLVIGGKYLVKGKTREDMLQNADALIAREHAAQ